MVLCLRRQTRTRRNPILPDFHADPQRGLHGKLYIIRP